MRRPRCHFKRKATCRGRSKSLRLEGRAASESNSVVVFMGRVKRSSFPLDKGKKVNASSVIIHKMNIFETEQLSDLNLTILSAWAKYETLTEVG